MNKLQKLGSDGAISASANVGGRHHMVLLAFALVVLAIFGGDNQHLPSPTSTNAAPKASVKLTPSLVAWISAQSEKIVEEMEAIAKQQVETSQFSVVLYLRYLNLFEELQVVANVKGSKTKIDKFNWIVRKVKAFSMVRSNVYEMVEMYLIQLEAELSTIESKEPKGAQVTVSEKWVEIYETINYIASHAPAESYLTADARQALDKSPTGAPDKRRSTRYVLYRRAFH